MSPRRPAVSIVVPTHDRAAWLPRTIDSVLAQDYGDVELVVVDDGSADATASVLTRYARQHPRSRFQVLSQANAGQAAAINRGWEIARGDIVGYLSDDDTLMPSAVSRLVDALEREPGAAGAYPAYRVVDEHGDIRDTVLPIEYSPERALRLHDTVIGPGALVRRAALERAGGWDPAFRWMGDLLLWVRIGLEGAMVRVPEVLAAWTRHPGATTLRLCLAHSREHLRLAQVGLSLDWVAAAPRSMRAEMLRNACVTAAMFGGRSGTWPSDRFAVIDLHAPRRSGWVGGRHRTAFPGADGDRTIELWRRIASAIERRMRLVRGPARPTGGFDAALATLAAAGVWPPDVSPTNLDERGVRRALLEAALACGADTDAASTRFILFEGDDASGLDDETRRFTFSALYGLAGSRKELERELRRQAAIVDRLRSSG